MPNWCENHLRLDGLPFEVASQVKDNLLLATNENGRGIFPEFLSLLHPIPDLRKIFDNGQLEDIALKDYHQQVASDVHNQHNCGIIPNIKEVVGNYINNWEFNWQRNNWQVKWDIYIHHERPVDALFDHGDDCIELEFLSPWSPPIGTYQHLHQKGVQVKAYYCEFGLDYCGLWTDGKDLDYRISDRDYPENIDEMFHITERTHDWEQDPTPL